MGTGLTGGLVFMSSGAFLGDLGAVVMSGAIAEGNTADAALLAGWGTPKQLLLQAWEPGVRKLRQFGLEWGNLGKKKLDPFGG